MSIIVQKFGDDRPIRARVILGKPEGDCITPPTGVTWPLIVAAATGCRSVQLGVQMASIEATRADRTGMTIDKLLTGLQEL